MKRLFLIVLVMVVLAGAALLIVGRRDDEAVADSIVLVILDTVRADRPGCLGGARGLTPELDRFATGAAVFGAAFSHAPWTLPAVASLYTGQLPAAHGAGGHLGSFHSLGEGSATLAELCRDAGLATGAVVNVQFLTDRFGMTRGFDHVDAHVPTTNRDDRKAGPTTDAALEWLGGQGGEPFLLLVHYFDPHLVYDPPQPFRRRFADPRDAERGEHLFGMFGEMQALRRGDIALTDEALARLEGLYDGEVASVDHEFGRLLRGIASLGLDGRTVVCVAADHGEEFGDHGGFEHGHTLYDELLHVPLLLRAPGLTGAAHWDARGRETDRVATSDPGPADVRDDEDAEDAVRMGAPHVTATVRLMDVAPTLCELIGLPVAPGFDGASLAPLLRDASAADRPVVSMGNMWGPGGACLRQGSWKIIVEYGSAPEVAGGPSSGQVLQTRLYQVSEDPGETVDLAAEHPRRRDSMLGDLLRLLDLAADRREAGTETELSAEERARLQSLGYVD